MSRRLLILLAPALAACASAGDYDTATTPPAPAGPAQAVLPAKPFIVTAPGPAGPATAYRVVPVPARTTTNTNPIN